MIRHHGREVSVAMAMAVLAVVLGTLILKEPFSARMAVAAGVVLAGIVLVRSE